METKNLYIDVATSNYDKYLKFVQGDNNIDINIYLRQLNSAYYNTSKTYCDIKLIRENETEIYLATRKTITINSSLINITLSKDNFNENGIFPCIISIYDDNGSILNTQPFLFIVEAMYQPSGSPNKNMSITKNGDEYIIEYFGKWLTKDNNFIVTKDDGSYIYLD